MQTITDFKCAAAPKSHRSDKVTLMPIARAIQFLENETRGLIFSCYFQKRTDGTMRFMRCRRGVRQNLAGVGLGYDPKAHTLLTVYDMQNKGYRSIPLERLVSFNIHGETFIVV